MSNIGRPLKFTPERRAAILDAIGKRIPYILAAEANGICEDTLYDWLKQGRRDQNKGIDSEYARFSESIKKIELEKMHEHLECIKNKPERWQADAWLLERRWWQHFSPNAAVLEFDKRLRKMEDDKQGALENEADREEPQQDT